MKVKEITIDINACEGCGSCVKLYPNVFKINNNVAEVRVEAISELNGKDIELVADSCPSQAIEYIKEFTPAEYITISPLLFLDYLTRNPAIIIVIALIIGALAGAIFVILPFLFSN